MSFCFRIISFLSTLCFKSYVLNILILFVCTDEMGLKVVYYTTIKLGG